MKGIRNRILMFICLMVVFMAFTSCGDSLFTAWERFMLQRSGYEFLDDKYINRIVREEVSFGKTSFGEIE